MTTCECELGHIWPEEQPTPDCHCPVCGGTALPEAPQLVGIPMMWKEIGIMLAILGLLGTIGLVSRWRSTPAQAHRSDWLAAAISQDGRLWTGGEDGGIAIWSPADGKRETRFDVQMRVDDLAVSPDGSRFLVVTHSGSEPGQQQGPQVACFSRQGDEPLWQRSLDARDAQFSRNGKVLTWRHSPKAELVNPENGEVVTSLEPRTATTIDVLAISDDESRIAVSESSWERKPPVIILSDREGNELWRRTVFEDQQPFGEVRCLLFTPQGDRLIVAGGADKFRGNILFLDTASGMTVESPEQLKAQIRALAISPDGNVLLVVDDSGSVTRYSRGEAEWTPKVIHRSSSGVIRPVAGPDATTWALPGYKQTVWGQGETGHSLAHESRRAIDWKALFMVAGLMMVPLLAVIPVLWIILGRSRKTRRQIERIAEELQFTFCKKPSSRLVQRLASHPHFQRGRTREFRNVVQGMLDSREAIGGILTTTTGSGKNRHSTSRFLLMLPGSGVNVPPFLLEPENVGHRLLDKFVGKDIDFSGSAAAETFSKRYRLTGANEEAIRELFDLQLIEYFAENPGWRIECGGRHLSFERSLFSESWWKGATSGMVDADFTVKTWAAAMILTRSFRREAGDSAQPDSNA